METPRLWSATRKPSARTRTRVMLTKIVAELADAGAGVRDALHQPRDDPGRRHRHREDQQDGQALVDGVLDRLGQRQYGRRGRPMRPPAPPTVRPCAARPRRRRRRSTWCAWRACPASAAASVTGTPPTGRWPGRFRRGRRRRGSARGSPVASGGTVGGEAGRRRPDVKCAHVVTCSIPGSAKCGRVRHVRGRDRSSCRTRNGSSYPATGSDDAFGQLRPFPVRAVRGGRGRAVGTAGHEPPHRGQDQHDGEGEGGVVHRARRHR